MQSSESDRNTKGFSYKVDHRFLLLPDYSLLLLYMCVPDPFYRSRFTASTLCPLDTFGNSSLSYATKQSAGTSALIFR